MATNSDDPTTPILTPGEEYIGSPEPPTISEYVGRTQPPKTQDKSIHEKQEDTRKTIAIVVSACYGAIILIIVMFFVYDGLKHGFDKDKFQSIGLLLAPVNTLLSVVIGFYFATKPE